MISNLEQLLAGRRAHIDATSSRVAVAHGRLDSNSNNSKPQQVPLVAKPTHGFVGLMNQGATCYLNSFVQSLYMLPKFRKAVLEYVPLGSMEQKDDNHQNSSSLCQALQQLFFRLHLTSNGATPTTVLTRAFGWSLEHVFEQHDVNELAMKMFEAMERELQEQEQLEEDQRRIMQLSGSNNDKEQQQHHPSVEHSSHVALSRALASFRGVQSSFVECLTCHTKRVRPEAFLTLCLPLPHAHGGIGGGAAGMGVASMNEEEKSITIDSCLRSLCTSETLDGSNAYNCSVCQSKQPASKGAEFEVFPEVLSLQLMRFDMDWERMIRMKIMTKVEFGRQLNVRPLMNDDAAHRIAKEHGFENADVDGAVDTCFKYDLFAILMHAGAAGGGHYYAYILDQSSKKWLKFNDSNVEWVSDEEVAAIFGEEVEVEVDVNTHSHKTDSGAAEVAPASPNTVATASGATAAPTSMPSHNSKQNDEDEDEGSDDDDDEEGRRRMRTARRAAPFVDPKHHAYILMYSRHSANTSSSAEQSKPQTESKQSVSDVHEHISRIREEIKKENEEFARRLALEKERRRRVELEILHKPFGNSSDEPNQQSAEVDVPASADADADEPCFGVVRTSLTLDKSQTLHALHEAVYTTLNLASHGFQLDDIRLRPWDGLTFEPGKPFNSSQLTSSMAKLGWKKRAGGFGNGKKTLVLETRDAAGQFPLYKPKQIKLQIVVLNEDALTTKVRNATDEQQQEQQQLLFTSTRDLFQPVREIQVDFDATIGEVRAQISSVLSSSSPSLSSPSSSVVIAPDAVKIVLDRTGLYSELCDDDLSLPVLSIVSGETLYIDISDRPSVSTPTSVSSSSSSPPSSKPAPCRLIEILTRKARMISVTFNNPFAVFPISTSSASPSPSPPPSTSPPSISFTLRAAQESDAASLSTLARKTFFDTFGPDNDPKHMTEYLDGAFSEKIQREEILDPNVQIWIVETAVNGNDQGQKEMIGYEMIRDGGETPDCVSSLVSHTPALELQRIYVAQSFHGKGVAQALMTQSKQFARQLKRPLWLGVWERNPRAIKFYTRENFRDVGAHTFMMGDDPQTDRVMLWTDDGGDDDDDTVAPGDNNVTNLRLSKMPRESSLQIEVDDRATVLDLKRCISQRLNHLPLDRFKIFLAGSGELKFMSRPLAFYGWTAPVSSTSTSTSSGSSAADSNTEQVPVQSRSVMVELGRPTKESEMMIRFVLYEPDKIRQDEKQKSNDIDEAQNGSIPVPPPRDGFGVPAAPPCAPPLAPPVAPPLAPSAPPCAPPIAPPAPPMAPPVAPAIGASTIPSHPPSSSAGSASSSSSALSSPLVFGPTDPFSFLGDLLVDGDAPIPKVEEVVVRHFAQVLHERGVHVDGSNRHGRMRLREKIGNRLTKVFRYESNVNDEAASASASTKYSLKANSSTGTWHDGKIIVVEPLPMSASASTTGSKIDLTTIKSPKHILLYIQRWDSRLKKLSPSIHELNVKADCSINELRQHISTLSELDATEHDEKPSHTPARIPACYIGLEKPLPYHLSSPSSLASLKFNIDWITPSSTLSSASSILRVRDGDSILYTDVRCNDVEQYAPFREEDDIIIKGVEAGSAAQERGGELKIFTPAEQREREEARRLKAAGSAAKQSLT